ncbi:MAG: NUDIX hydrolase [Candidatus Omnitrophica bacterium]|nr:NUDIX hydrolase [Candidatus Omnitrophota bacterium]
MEATTVAAIIFRTYHSRKEILLTKRNVPPYNHDWCFPGGHIDRGESAQDAVIREVKEETGLDIQPTFLFLYEERIKELNKHDWLAVYLAEAQGSLDCSEAEVQDIRWDTMQKALQRSLAFCHHDVLKRFFEEYPW